MAKNKTSFSKPLKKPEKRQLSSLCVWIFAIASMLIIPIIYNDSAIDQVLNVRFLGLALMLLLFYLFFLFSPKLDLPEMILFNRGALISWALFIAFSVLSLVNAFNPIEGLFDIFRSCLLFFFILAATGILVKSKDLKPFITAAAILAVIYLMVGYYQYFYYAFGHQDLKSLYKVIGIWTHKNFFSSMLYLLIPILVFSILTVKKGRNALLVLLFLIFTILFLLQTRSVWLAIIMFLLSTTTLLFVFRKEIFISGQKKMLFSGIKIISVALIISVAIAWTLTSISTHPAKSTNKIAQENKPSQPEISSIEKRAASMFDTKESNTKHRIDMWKMSFKMIAKHPILGVGAGNWKVVVSDYLTPNYNANYFNNIRRPHNDLIWVLSEKGIPGLLTYLAFFLFLLIYSIKLLKKDIKPFDKVLIILCISGIAGYFADASLSFPYERIEHQIMLMFYASVILYMFTEHFPIMTKMKNQKNQLFFKVFAVVFLGVAVIFGRIWLREEVYINKAYNAHFENNWEKTIEYINIASTSIDQLDPRNTPALWFRGKAYLQLNKENEAFEDLEKAYSQNPNSILVLVDLGVIYGKKGEYNKAIELFKKSLKIYPKYKDGLRNLGIAYYFTEKYPEALSCFNELASIDPNPEIKKLIEQIKNKELKK